MKLKQKVSSSGSRMQKIEGLWERAIKEPTFHQKVWGLWVTAETISKNMGSLGDSSAESRGSLEPYIRITLNGSAPRGKNASKIFTLFLDRPIDVWDN